MAEKQKNKNKSDEQELVFDEQEQSPETVSNRLREIADMLDKGEVTLGDQTFDIPDYVFFKTELEEEHNGDIAPVNFEIEIEIVFPVVLTVDN